MRSQGSETQVRSLYSQLLGSWNSRNARAFAFLFQEDGICVGFDGSQMEGPTEIEATLAGIFADHVTAAYVSKVREVRLLAPEVAILRAVVGMVPSGASDINPAANEIQTLVALRSSEEWRISLFQNTPAAFHGRPQLSEQLTNELRETWWELQASGAAKTN